MYRPCRLALLFVVCGFVQVTHGVLYSSGDGTFFYLSQPGSPGLTHTYYDTQSQSEVPTPLLKFFFNFNPFVFPFLFPKRSILPDLNLLGISRIARVQLRKTRHADNTIADTLIFREYGGAPGFISITGTITGLTPTNALHGIAIHETGVVINDCSLVGAHFNPQNAIAHGGPFSAIRHVGDLGNIWADAAGTATVNINDYLPNLSDPDSIIGKALVVYKNPDDLGATGTGTSTTLGNTGLPLACGVIVL